MCISFFSIIREIILVGGIIALLKLLLPWVFGLFGWNWGPLPQAINILIAVVVALFVLNVIVALWGCMGGFGHLAL